MELQLKWLLIFCYFYIQKKIILNLKRFYKLKNKNFEISVSLFNQKGVRRGEVTTWRCS